MKPREQVYEFNKQERMILEDYRALMEYKRRERRKKYHRQWAERKRRRLGVREIGRRIK
jgi:oligoendopeptidase F